MLNQEQAWSSIRVQVASNEHSTGMPLLARTLWVKRRAREESVCGTENPEFRRRAVEFAMLGEKPIAQIDRDLGIAESGLRREKRVLEMEVEILKRASAYFAQENVLPN